MQLIHCGAVYECAIAVKCENDNYIRLYNENGVEIISFYDISDYTDYELSGGSFVAPCDCGAPIPLSTYSIGSRTITPEAWIENTEANGFYYEIENALISDNTTTCNILLLFAEGTNFEYKGSQENGKIVLSVSAAPLVDIVIDSIQITRT